jgi:hypothetical protein
MIHGKLIAVASIALINFSNASAQSAPTNPVNFTVPAPNYFFTVDPSPDPALRHNKLLMEKTGEGMLRQIGTYKVKGTPYLYSGRNKGDMFSKDTKAYNILLSYDTYNQEVGFYSTSNPTNQLIKEPGDLDSFILHADPDMEITSNQKFVYGDLIGAKDKSYYEEIYAGPQYSIYKKYKSELGYVSDNYATSDLRQFDLNAEFYYTGPDKKPKKIKANSYNVIKEFKGVKDLSQVINDDIFVANAEQAFRKTFEYLNR